MLRWNKRPTWYYFTACNGCYPLLLFLTNGSCSDWLVLWLATVLIRHCLYWLPNILNITLGPSLPIFLYWNQFIHLCLWHLANRRTDCRARKRGLCHFTVVWHLIDHLISLNCFLIYKMFLFTWVVSHIKYP